MARRGKPRHRREKETKAGASDRPAPRIPPSLVLITPPLVYALLWLVLLDPRPAPGGDNLIYLLLARGLAEGRGLSEIWLPEALPHTRYPFAFPALLAPLYALSHGSLLALKAAMGVVGLCSVVLTQVYLGRQGRAIAFWGALALACSPLLLEFAGDTFTEVPFLAITLLSLLVYDLSEAGRRRGPLLAALGLSVIGAWVRLIGITLAAAYGMALVRARRRGPALAAAVALAAGLGLWLPSLLSRGGYVAELAGVYALDDRGTPAIDSLGSRQPPPEPVETGRGASGRIAHRVEDTLRLLLMDPAPLAVALFPWTSDLAFPRIACTLLALALLAVHLARRLRAAPGDPVPAYLLLSGGLLFVWAAALARFLLPLLPLLLLALLAFARDRAQGRGFTAVGLLLVGSQLAGVVGRLPEAVDARAEVGRGNEAAGLPGVIAQSRRAEVWARSGLPPGAVLAARKPAVAFYFGGHASVPYPATSDPRAFARELVRAGADYLLVELEGRERTRLASFFQAYAAKLPLVFETGEPWNVVVLDLAPLRQPGGMEPASRRSGWPPATRFPQR